VAQGHVESIHIAQLPRLPCRQSPKSWPSRAWAWKVTLRAEARDFFKPDRISNSR